MLEPIHGRVQNSPDVVIAIAFSVVIVLIRANPPHCVSVRPRARKGHTRYADQVRGAAPGAATDLSENVLGPAQCDTG